MQPVVSRAAVFVLLSEWDTEREIYRMKTMQTHFRSPGEKNSLFLCEVLKRRHSKICLVYFFCKSRGSQHVKPDSGTCRLSKGQWMKSDKYYFATHVYKLTLFWEFNVKVFNIQMLLHFIHCFVIFILFTRMQEMQSLISLFLGGGGPLDPQLHRVLIEII